MSSIELMKQRLDNSNQQNYTKSNLEGVNLQAARLRALGGYSQQERMIFDKRKSLERALWNSYQGAQVIDIGTGEITKALINPNTVKQDYDDKVISIKFESGFKPGTVFEWYNTNSFWIVYLQDLTELAYFKGDIRRCTYKLEWKDDDGKLQSSYAALTGPKETGISTSSRHGLIMDKPNYTLSLLIPENIKTAEFFKRYNKFFLKEICWEIQAIDNITTPGIIQVYAQESYANATEDDIKNGIVGEFITKEIDPNPADGKILGNTFIYPKSVEKYINIDENEYSWSIDPKYPVSLQQINNREVEIKWEANYSGQFELKCGPLSKTIVVQSLF